MSEAKDGERHSAIVGVKRASSRADPSIIFGDCRRSRVNKKELAMLITVSAAETVSRGFRDQEKMEVLRTCKDDPRGSAKLLSVIHRLTLQLLYSLVVI